MTITLSLRFLYILGGSGLLCSGDRWRPAATGGNRRQQKVPRQRQTAACGVTVAQDGVVGSMIFQHCTKHHTVKEVTQ